MDIILKTRCNKGQLIVYKDRISIELNGFGVRNSNSIAFENMTGVDIKTTMAKIPLLCEGYADVKIFATGDQKIEVKMVKLADAHKIEEIVRQKAGKKINNSVSIDELEKLADLKEKGIITKEEFEGKKKQILGI